MAAQKGKNFILAVDLLRDGNFVTGGGFRSNGLSITNEQVDTTSKDDDAWGKTLPGGGSRSMQTTASGVFTSDAVLKECNNAALNGTALLCRIIVPGLGTYEGEFDLESFGMSGEYNGEITYDLTLNANGQPTFTAE